MKPTKLPFETVIEVLDPVTAAVLGTFRGTYGDATRQAHREHPRKTLWVMRTFVNGRLENTVRRDYRDGRYQAAGRVVKDVVGAVDEFGARPTAADPKQQSLFE